MTCLRRRSFQILHAHLAYRSHRHLSGQSRTCTCHRRHIPCHCHKIRAQIGRPHRCMRRFRILYRTNRQDAIASGRAVYSQAVRILVMAFLLGVRQSHRPMDQVHRG